MSTNTASFKTETLNLSNMHIYNPLDRINESNRAFPSFPRHLATIKDQLFCPSLWSRPQFTLGFITSLKLKVIRIYDSLCTSSGVRTYFYKLVGSEFGFMYQKRPMPQKDFGVIYPNLTHMFNDAICSGHSNVGTFPSQTFDIGDGVSRRSLQYAILEYWKKSNRALSISEVTYGTLIGSEDKYNIFIRNYPKLDQNGKAIKCKKKVIALKGEDTKTGQKIAFYSGDCFAPVEVTHHECKKLVSEDEALSVTFDIFVLYSVSQDMYTIFKPNGLRAFDYNHNGHLDGLYISKEKAMTAISEVIRLEQKALDLKAKLNQVENDRKSKAS